MRLGRVAGLVLLGVVGAVALTAATMPSSPTPQVPGEQALLEKTPASPPDSATSPDTVATGTPETPPQRASSTPASPEPAPLPLAPRPGAPQVHLTFDDGPDPTFTPIVLDLLAEHGAKATFFVQGSQVRAYPELATRITAEGHSLQNHSWSHARLIDLGYEQILSQELEPTSLAITEVTGTRPTCVRAPFGQHNATVLAASASAGLTHVGWSINPSDYAEVTAASINQSVLTQLHPGANVLLHDAGGTPAQRTQTVGALAMLLPALAERGYAATSVCN